MNCWHYLLLVNIYLVLFYGFYALLLRRETFFQLNRVYLVAAVIFSFFIPVIQADWVKNLFITQKVQYTLYSSPITIYQFEPIKEAHITIGQVFISAYLAGVVFLAARFIWQLIVLKKEMASRQLPGPYSFFKKIKLDDDQKEYQVVAAHEQVHAAQWHSADVLLMELVVLINWFNPVVYLYRLAIKHVHEFIADSQAIQSGTDKSAYALLLLSQTFNSPVNQLVNQFFNHSLLKQRIMMLHKNKSQRIALIKYGLSAPLFILMLVLSSATINNSKTIKLINKHAQQVLSAPVIEPGHVKTSDNQPLEADNGVIAATPDKPSIAIEPSAVPQKDTITDKKVFTEVEQVPEFPGGIQAFGRFLSANIKYPSAMRTNSIQGRVIISFIVEKDGALTGVKVVKGVGYGGDEEAVRVINLSPKWNPGIQNGKPVRVSYAVPITFALSEERVNDNGNQKNGNASSPSSSATDVVGFKADTEKSKQTLVLNGPNHPLIILDGKEITDIKSLNSDDIQRIDVIKDKSATALYGSKGANGVIIITSKKKVKL